MPAQRQLVAAHPRLRSRAASTAVVPAVTRVIAATRASVRSGAAAARVRDANAKPSERSVAVHAAERYRLTEALH